MANSPNCRTGEAPQVQTDKQDVHDDKKTMPDYIKSSTNRVVGIRMSEVLTNKICNEFSDVFQG